MEESVHVAVGGVAVGSEGLVLGLVGEATDDVFEGENPEGPGLEAMSKPSGASRGRRVVRVTGWPVRRSTQGRSGHWLASVS